MDISRATFYTLLYTENHTCATNLCLQPSVEEQKIISRISFSHISKQLILNFFFSLFGLN